MGDLVKIGGIMDKKVYHNIIMRHAVPSGPRLIGNNFVLSKRTMIQNTPQTIVKTT